MTISQSSTAATRWSSPKIMLPIRESPQHSAGRGRSPAGRWPRGSRRRGPPPGRARRRTRSARYSRSSSSCSVGRRRRAIHSSPTAARSSWWMRAIVSRPLSHTRRWPVGGEGRHPALARGSRGCRPGTSPVDPAHAHEPGAEDRRVLLEPQHLGHRAPCPRACSACITCTWVSKAVAGKTVWPGGLDPDHERVDLTVPGGFEEERLVREAGQARDADLADLDVARRRSGRRATRPDRLAGRPDRAPSRLPSACDPPGASDENWNVF